jgi:hypothetical protein
MTLQIVRIGTTLLKTKESSIVDVIPGASDMRVTNTAKRPRSLQMKYKRVESLLIRSLTVGAGNSHASWAAFLVHLGVDLL